MEDRDRGADPIAWSLAAFLIPLGVYLVTLCPTVYVGDSGEMVTLAHLLGIAQPTGFPLYCLLGKIFSLVPVGSLAARVNALSAVATAVAAWAAYRVAARRVRPPLALAGSLWFALGLTAWSQATIARTYPLTMALLAVELELALDAAARPGSRRVLALTLVAGLSFGTHLLSVVILPILVYLAWRERWPRRLAGTALVLCGLSLYVYLPLRTGVTAYNAYGPVETATQLADYLTQKRYAGKQFARSPENARTFFSILGRRFATDQPLAPLALPLVCAGLVIAARRWPTLAVFLVVPACANLAILYGYGDDQDLPFAPRYFLWVLFAEGILFAVGLEALARRGPAAIVIGAAGLALAYGAHVNYRASDRSRTVFCAEYARALIEPLPPNAVLFLAGDASTLMLDYFQYCENLRRDVKCGEPAQFKSLLPRLNFGTFPKFPLFANFKPAPIPRLTLPHVGLSWQIANGPPALDRARFWARWTFAGLETDPALSDYEAAAVAGEILFHRGLDHLEDGHEREAREAFDRAERASPENRLLFYSLARTYASMKDRAAARRTLDRALELDVTARASGPEYRLNRAAEIGL